MKNKTIISIVICLVLIPSLAYGGFIDDLKLLTQSLWQWTEQEELGASTKVGNYQGGTGQDSSAWEGVAQVASGVWSADNDLSVTTLTATDATVTDDFYVGGLLKIGGTAGTNVDMANYLITNIGAGGTDFTTGGGLNIATDLLVSGSATSSDFEFLGTLTAQGNIIPKTDSASDLGSASKLFANTYTDKIYMNMTEDDMIIDGTTNYYIKFKFGAAELFNIRSNQIEAKNTLIARTIRPETASGYSLGVTDYEWANLYIGTGRAYFGATQLSSIYASGNDLIITPTGDVSITTDLTVSATTTSNTLNINSGNLYVSENGNVGIGTTTPRYTLDVWGSLAVGTTTSEIFKVDSGEQLITVGADMSVGSLQVDEDSGAVTILDMSVSATPAAGTEQSYCFNHDASSTCSVLFYAESDGAGGVKNQRVGIATSTPEYRLDVNGIIRADRIRLLDIWHVYGGFQNATTTIACTKEVWAKVTTGGGIWTATEADGVTLSDDVMTITNAGDYFGTMSLTISGSNGDDYYVRVWNTTTDAIAGYKIGITTTGANNFQSITLPLYFENSAGDQYEVQIMNASNNNDPRVRDSVFYISYLHER